MNDFNEFSRPTLARLQERLAALAPPHCFLELDANGLATLEQMPGLVLVFFAEDPLKLPEAWDLAVILADALKSLPEPVAVALVPPGAGAAQAGRWGVTLRPSLVALRAGGYLASLEGMMDWSEFSQRLRQVLAAPVSRPPGIGIPVNPAPHP